MNSWKLHESNPGPLGEKPKCFPLCNGPARYTFSKHYVLNTNTFLSLNLINSSSKFNVRATFDHFWLLLTTVGHSRLLSAANVGKSFKTFLLLHFFCFSFGGQRPAASGQRPAASRDEKTSLKIVIGWLRFRDQLELHFWLSSWRTPVQLFQNKSKLFFCLRKKTIANNR